MKHINFRRLLKTNFPWAYLAICSEKEIDNFVYEEFGRESETLTRIIRGKRCQTQKQLFQEWAAALQFPYYFGHNWDAWDECLADLSWLPASSYVFFVTSVDALLSEDNYRFATFISLLGKIANEWTAKEVRTSSNYHSPVHFGIVFQCEADGEIFTRERLRQAGIDVSTSIPS